MRCSVGDGNHRSPARAVIVFNHWYVFLSLPLSDLYVYDNVPGILSVVKHPVWVQRTGKSRAGI